MQQQLMALRIIWAAMLMGQIMFLAITLTIAKNMAGLAPKLASLFLYCAIGMLVVLVPVAYVIRGIVYRGGRGEDGLIAPQQYASGNILFWAMCEGVGLAAITFGLLNRGQGPVLFIAAVAIAVQAVNFPTGRAMRRD